MKHVLKRIGSALLSPLGLEVVGVRESRRLDMFVTLRRSVRHCAAVASVIDIGASNGSWSARARQVLPEARFVGVEPLAEREQELALLKTRNAWFDYVIAAAGDADGARVEMHVSGDLDGSTVGAEGPGTKRMVAVRTVDSIVREKGLAGPYLLKLDTHGFEVPILKGASAALRETELVILETYNFPITARSLRFQSMIDHMEALGFRCLDIASPVWRRHDGAFWQLDLFFARSTNAVFAHNEYR